MIPLPQARPKIFLGFVQGLSLNLFLKSSGPILTRAWLGQSRISSPTTIFAIDCWKSAHRSSDLFTIKKLSFSFPSATLLPLMTLVFAALLLLAAASSGGIVLSGCRGGRREYLMVQMELPPNSKCSLAMVGLLMKMRWVGSFESSFGDAVRQSESM